VSSMGIADTILGSDGKTYVVPINAGLTGLSWADPEEAEKVVNAINRAYLMGREDFRKELSELISGGCDAQ
jgi:hypothetical protein